MQPKGPVDAFELLGELSANDHELIEQATGWSLNALQEDSLPGSARMKLLAGLWWAAYKREEDPDFSIEDALAAKSKEYIHLFRTPEDDEDPNPPAPTSSGASSSGPPAETGS